LIQKALQHKGYLISGFLFILLIIILSLSYALKDEQSTSIDKTIDEKKPVKVGILFDNYVVERWTSDRDAFEKAINDSKENITVTSKSANSDIKIQIEQLNKFIDDNYNIIAIVPIDPKQLASSVKKAKEKGITVISYDRLLTGCGCDLYLSFDNKKVGTLMGNSVKKLDIPNKKVIMLSGPDTDYNANLVNKGFKEVLNENNIEIIDEKHIENWDYDLALEYINNNLNKVNKANVIMCGNDTIARRVIESLASNNIKDKYIPKANFSFLYIGNHHI